MIDPDATPEALRWLRYAREDLDIAERIMSSSAYVPRHACGFAQQAAEKAMKAALVLEGIDVPYTHDLRAIRNVLPDEWPTEIGNADLAQLTVWGAESRYPGDWDEPTSESAVRAMADARTVLDAITTEFASRGVTYA